MKKKNISLLVALFATTTIGPIAVFVFDENLFTITLLVISSIALAVILMDLIFLALPLFIFSIAALWQRMRRQEKGKVK